MEIDKVAMLLSQGIPMTIDEQDAQVLIKISKFSLKLNMKEKEHESFYRC